MGTSAGKHIAAKLAQTLMKRILFCIPVLLLLCCNEQNTKPVKSDPVDALAEKYVRLGLTIGLYDPDFVDAYYGPDSLKPVLPKQMVIPKDSLLRAVNE